MDYNAWLQCTNPRPDADGNTRTTAGHIHLGAIELKDQSLVEQTVKVLDLFLGVPSVLIDPERERRKLYGKAGCFRFGKSYVGLEYRSLSNFWLKSEELMGWVYDNTKLAVDFLNSDKTINEEDEQIIQTAMNEYNEDYCKYLVEKYNIEMPVKQLITV